MNRKKIIVIVIFLFAIISILAVITQRPNQALIKQTSEVSSNNSVGADMAGATNIKSFADIYSVNKTNNRTINKTTATVKPTVTPKPPPYPRITINYTLQKTDSIRGIKAGSNNSFILISVDIRNYGYKYFDADPNKFRLDPLSPILNVSTGNMLNEVIPNSSETQGDLVFLVNNKQRYNSRLSYIGGYTVGGNNVGGYTIVYKFGGQTGGSVTKSKNVIYPNGE